MSLLPLILNDTWLDLLDQHFGMGLDLNDLLTPVNAYVVRYPAGYIRPRHSAATAKDTGCADTANKDKFQVSLDVQQFKPEEITVKVTDSNTITVEGKHEEKRDEHGFVSRQFVRRYILPDGHNINNVVSKLSSDGVLSITAPRMKQRKDEERSITIQQTGVPLKPIKNKEE